MRNSRSILSLRIQKKRCGGERENEAERSVTSTVNIAHLLHLKMKVNTKKGSLTKSKCTNQGGAGRDSYFNANVQFSVFKVLFFIVSLGLHESSSYVAGICHVWL